MRFTERHAWSGEGGVRKFVAPAEKAIDGEARTIAFTVSTGTRDRDGDIVEPGGWRVEGYLRNPQILWAHDSRQPPVGKALSVRVEGEALRAVAQFATAEDYPFADTVFRLYRGGYLNAFSAGFMPLRASQFEADGRTGFRIAAAELWEISCVPIPSNPDALVAAKAAAIDVGPVAEAIERALDEGALRGAREALSTAYVRLKGQVHPVIQRELAARNFGAKAPPLPDPAPDPANEAPMPEPPAPVAEQGEVFTTSEAGEPLHAHEFARGDTVTTEAGDPPHAHAVTLAEDGAVTIEPAEGHAHDAPAGAVAPATAPEETPPAAKTAPLAKQFVRWATDWGVGYGYLLAETEIGVALVVEMREFAEGWKPSGYGLTTVPDEQLERIDALPTVGAQAKAAPTAKEGRVLSRRNAELVRAARDALDELLSAAEKPEPEAPKAAPAPKAAAPAPGPEFVAAVAEAIGGAVRSELRRMAGRV